MVTSNPAPAANGGNPAVLIESVPVNPYVLQNSLTLADTGRAGNQAKVAELVDALDSKSSLAHTR